MRCSGFSVTFLQSSQIMLSSFALSLDSQNMMLYSPAVYSTVTLFARFLSLSTSSPFATDT